jgi:hypothetical protein
MLDVLHPAQTWGSISRAISTLDVLSALARFAHSPDGPTCFPTFTDAAAPAEFNAADLWHPALAACSGTPPVPSTVRLGSLGSGACDDTGGHWGSERCGGQQIEGGVEGEARQRLAPAMLLTGPNMVRGAIFANFQLVPP